MGVKKNIDSVKYKKAIDFVKLKQKPRPVVHT